MSPALQTRLLRVLAEGEFYRVGGSTPIRVDVRVIAATHQDLDARREARAVPRRPAAPAERDPHPRAAAARAAATTSRSCSPLPRARGARARRRAEDAPAEARSRLVRFALAGQRAPARERVPPPDGRCARAARSATEDIPAGPRRRRRAAAELRTTGAASSRPGRRGTSRAAGRRCSTSRTERFERTLARAALERVQGHRQEAAKLLGWGRNTLTRKLRELGHRHRMAA